MYTWFKIFNRNDFDALGLVSKTYTLFLEGIGQKSILVTKGHVYGMTYEGVFLPLQLNGENPFAFEGYAIYTSGSGNVWLGIEVPDA